MARPDRSLIFGPRRRQCYRNAVEQHLTPRFATRRLDTISPDDLAALVRELRADGLAESTIVIVVGVVNRIYRYAARRVGWAGTNPVALLLPSERPKPGQSAKRRLFEGGELEQTIAAADEPFRTLFTLAALTGARAVGAAGTHVGKRPDHGPGGCRGGVRVAGRSPRQRPADKDGRLRREQFRSRGSWQRCCSHHKEPIAVQGSGGLRVLHVHRSAARAAQRRSRSAQRAAEGG